MVLTVLNFNNYYNYNSAAVYLTVNVLDNYNITDGHNLLALYTVNSKTGVYTFMQLYVYTHMHNSL